MGSFGPREWKAFELFLNSLPNKNREEQLQLFLFVKQLCLAESQREPTKGEMAAWVYPEQNVSAQTIRYLESDLVRSVENWWIKQELKDNSLLRNTILLRAMSKRGLQKPFSSLLQRSEALLQSTQHWDMDFLFYRYQLNNLAFEFASRQENRGIDPGLQSMLEDLEELYISGSLKYGSILVNLGNVTSAPVDPVLVMHLRNLGEQALTRGYAGADVYCHVLLTLVGPDEEENYHQLLAKLEEDKDVFSPEEMGQLYAFALNYCIKRLNEGREDYLQKLFQLYQRLLDHRIIFSGEYILQQHFKNIVTTAIRLEEYAWTWSFLEHYIQFVPATDRKNASTYNHAALHFAQGNYSAALRLLQEVEFTDVYYHVDSKALLLKTYFELGDWEPSLSLMEAFGIYLRRNRAISPYQRKVYSNFLKFFKKLVRKRLGSRKKITEILAEMDAVREIADLRWLKLKAAEF